MKLFIHLKNIGAICLVWIVVLLFSTTVFAQPAINRIEYFLDNDPGYGSASNLTFTGTNNATGTINIDLATVSQGVHIVGVRSRDANGAWSIDNKWIFVKPYTNTGAVPQPNINRAEWYLDADPGYGNATPITISAGQDLSGLAINIDILPLTQGVHIVAVRSRDANGAWSLDNKWIFLKPYANSGAVPQPNINRVEWFLDTDPGYGNATPITIVPGQNLVGLAINIDLLTLNQGVHIVGVRSRDANGAWSLDNKWIFLKPYTNSGAIPQPNITAMEYFIDTDPGYGNASLVTISNATDIANVIFNADISTVVNGAHKLGIRTKDANGAWSIDNKVDFTGGTLSNTTYNWVGVTSSAWETSSNWSSGIVPAVGNAVLIPSGTPFSPVIANGIIGTCKSIQINPGAIISVETGGKLKVGL